MAVENFYENNSSRKMPTKVMCSDWEPKTAASLYLDRHLDICNSTVLTVPLMAGKYLTELNTTKKTLISLFQGTFYV